MDLSVAKVNTPCMVVSINIEDERMKIRLMELGLIVGSIVSIKKRSALKKTMLLAFNSSCFTMKSAVAKFIEVIYE